jgi:prolyl 4-hydroxylase
MKSTLECPSSSTNLRDAAAVLEDQNIVAVDGVLPASICRRIVAGSLAGIWAPSTIAGRGAKQVYGHRPQGGRNSLTLCEHNHPAWMARCLDDLAETLRCSLGIRPRNLEPWQVTRYIKGQWFDFHLDCGCWYDHPSGERKRSVLLYLETPKRGGTTVFRALNVEVKPAAGRLVVWNNLLPNGNCNHAMVHASLPVTEGSKTILTTWERERRYAKNRES